MGVKRIANPVPTEGTCKNDAKALARGLHGARVVPRLSPSRGGGVGGSVSVGVEWNMPHNIFPAL